MKTAVDRVAAGFIRRKMARKPGIPLDKKLRRPIARALEAKGLDGNGRFNKPRDGWAEVEKILKHFGLFPERDVPRRWLDDGLEKNRFTIGLEVPSPDGRDMIEINNARVAFSFHRHDYGNFEVLVYIS